MSFTDDATMLAFRSHRISPRGIFINFIYILHGLWWLPCNRPRIVRFVPTKENALNRYDSDERRAFNVCLASFPRIENLNNCEMMPSFTRCKIALYVVRLLSAHTTNTINCILNVRVTKFIWQGVVIAHGNLCIKLPVPLLGARKSNASKKKVRASLAVSRHSSGTSIHMIKDKI